MPPENCKGPLEVCACVKICAPAEAEPFVGVAVDAGAVDWSAAAVDAGVALCGGDVGAEAPGAPHPASAADTTTAKVRSAEACSRWHVP